MMREDSKQNLTAQIYLTGLWGIDKPEFIEKKKFDSEKLLKDHLHELQKEYGGRRKIEAVDVPIAGEVRHGFQINSDVDWGHLAIICGEKGIKTTP